MYWRDTGWEIQVLFTVGAGLRSVCLKPERRPLGSSNLFVLLSVRPSARPYFRTYQCGPPLGDYPSNLKISTSKIGENRTKIVDILYIDLCMLHCCRLHRFPTKALLSRSNYFCIIGCDRQLNNGPRILVLLHSEHGSKTTSRCHVTNTFHILCHFYTLSSPVLCPLPV